ncbi:MAG: glycosyltransferase family 4 protein [Patescibacteria group bacterium]|nr:glycosyltransferase family 4 protein [Patescibacteria group bacterium]
MNSLRILITTGIFPPSIGGPARIVEQLSSDLSLKNIKVSVLAFGEEDGKIRSYNVFKCESKINFALSVWRLGKEADVIYTFDLYTAGFFSWLIGKVILRKKLIVRFAGDSAWESAYNQGLTKDDILTFQEKFYGIKIWMMKKARSLILKGADSVVSVSYFMKNLAEKIGVEKEKIEVIYNSVDFIDFKNLNCETEILQDKFGLRNLKIIVTAGRFVPWKGIDGLIKAIDLLKSERQFSFKLLIIGDGPDFGNLKALVDEKGLNDEILFTGKIPQDKMFAYLNLADVFVLNSKYEGLSHVLLEALRAGKPIVASDCGGNSEVVENEKNGLLVEYNNIKQLSEAVKIILTEEKWRASEFKKICVESLKKFSWQNVVERTVNVFDKIKQKHE